MLTVSTNTIVLDSQTKDKNQRKSNKSHAYHVIQYAWF